MVGPTETTKFSFGLGLFGLVIESPVVMVIAFLIMIFHLIELLSQLFRLKNRMKD